MAKHSELIVWLIAVSSSLMQTAEVIAIETNREIFSWLRHWLTDIGQHIFFSVHVILIQAHKNKSKC